MKKILYFVCGLPDEAEIQEAKACHAMLRDCSAWHDGDFVEECDLVLGKPANVPPPYRHLWQGKDKGASKAARSRKKEKRDKD